MTQPPQLRFAFYPTAVAVMVLAVAGISCSPAPEPIETPPPETATMPDPPTASEAAPIATPTAVLPDGSTIAIELAITPDELAQGLMFRPHLPDDRGMLLLFAEERLPNIWMMNTLIALDIIYLDSTGKVVDIVVSAQPCPAEPCPRFTPKQAARAVLEISAGGAARYGIVEGAVLGFSQVPGFPATD
ncbi:MAG: DUF192 domain-containing protein [Thermoanaerobaculales bacterium]|nr:DUF192 domain-containing protein [Thermoanaerobaculales bacterium]